LRFLGMEEAWHLSRRDSDGAARCPQHVINSRRFCGDYSAIVFVEADPVACCCVAPFFSSATARTSSTFSTGTNLSFCFASSGTSKRSFSLSFGMMTVEMPARICGQTFLLQTADWQNQPAQTDFASHGDVWSDGGIAEERGKGGEHGNSR